MNPEKNRRILVIDDNRSIHDDFRKILSSAGPAQAAISLTETQLFGIPAEARQPQFEIDSAYQGEEGVELVKKALAEGRPYAMAFVDMRMPPGWYGIKTAQEIWKVDPEIHIAICTAYSAYSWEEMLEQIGNIDRIDILKKPFDPVEALRMANELTEKWRRIHLDLKKKPSQSTSGLS
jgi:DNA-binding NtrC family response regulator